MTDPGPDTPRAGRPRRRLHVRFTLLVGALMAVFGLALTVVNTRSQETMLQQRLRSEARALARVTAKAGMDDFAMLRVDKIRTLLTSVIAHDAAEYAYALDPEGRVLASGGDDPSLRHQELDDPVSRRAAEAKGALLQQDVIDLGAPGRDSTFGWGLVGTAAHCVG